MNSPTMHPIQIKFTCGINYFKIFLASSLQASLSPSAEYAFMFSDFNILPVSTSTRFAVIKNVSTNFERSPTIIFTPTIT